MATQVELFRFSEQGAPTVWTYTSGDKAVTYDAGQGDEVYAPVSLKRTTIESRSEMARANLDITVPLTNPAAVRWLADNGENIVSMTIWERSRVEVYLVAWKGRLVAVIPGMTDITLKFESIFTSLRRPGLRARYQKSCRHPLYHTGCNLNAEDFAVDATATDIVANVLTVTEGSEKPDGWYIGGMLRSPDGALSFIIDHIGDSIKLQRLSFSLTEAVTDGFPFAVKLYPGCPHNRQACNDKFDNILNYGGFDFIPVKNPMGGTSIT